MSKHPTIQPTVLWVGYYPSHYVRALHRELERARPPGFAHFVYVRDVISDQQRAYECGDLPEYSQVIDPSMSSTAFAFALAKWNPKIVVLAGYGNRFLNCALIWAWLAQRKFCFWSDTNVLEVLNLPLAKRAIRKLFLAPIFASAARLLYIGTRNRDYWIWLLGGENRVRNKLHHLPYPALVSPREHSGTTKNRATETLRLLYVGRLEQVKAIHKLVRAVAALRSSEVKFLLTLCGGGSEEATLKQLVHGLGVADLVEFTGQVPSDRVANAYAGADLFILPSDIEPWGLVVNEALAAGVPVMCPFWVGAVADLVIDGVTGFVLPGNDSASLAAGIRRAWENRSDLSLMGEHGRSHVVHGPWNLAGASRNLSSLIDSILHPTSAVTSTSAYSRRAATTSNSPYIDQKK
jgi:glycosyltransferase involved in cell wall biosynthesis